MRGPGVILLLFIASGASADVWSNIATGVSSAFGFAEEAPYTVVNTTPNAQSRQYPARTWACTTATGPTRKEATTDSMFMKLFRYITGENSRSESIKMTLPVTTEYTRGGSGTNTYTMCFYIDEDHQADPPSPNDETVFLQGRSALNIRTRTVGGYMSDESDWMDEAARLAEALQEEGMSVSLTHMYWVGYDAPIKFWKRRNEVWFPTN